MKNEGENYDKIAQGFANLRNEFHTEKKYLDLFIKYLAPNSSVLDIGCGTGHPIANYLIKNHFHVTGIDASNELLKIAKDKCLMMKKLHGDIRTIKLSNTYDGIIEWWCLFHLPKSDHGLMINRFANWLKPNGILEFTTGDAEYEGKSNAMLNQELCYYSLAPTEYEKLLQQNGFEILLKEADQDQHLVWIARRTT